MNTNAQWAQNFSQHFLQKVYFKTFLFLRENWLQNTSAQQVFPSGPGIKHSIKPLLR